MPLCKLHLSIGSSFFSVGSFFYLLNFNFSCVRHKIFVQILWVFFFRMSVWLSVAFIFKIMANFGISRSQIQINFRFIWTNNVYHETNNLEWLCRRKTLHTIPFRMHANEFIYNKLHWFWFVVCTQDLCSLDFISWWN